MPREPKRYRRTCAAAALLSLAALRGLAAEPEMIGPWLPDAELGALQVVEPPPTEPGEVYWSSDAGGAPAAPSPGDSGRESRASSTRAGRPPSDFLSRSLEPADDAEVYAPIETPEEFGMLRYRREPPLGFSGPSGVLPTETQQSAHFVPIEDRWRIGFPQWDRYGDGHPYEYDYPYVEGQWWNPYNQNVLKGDYPIVGQHTFLALQFTNLVISEFRQVPTPTTPFESTLRPNSEEFFGDPNQAFYANLLRMQVDLFHGNAGFKPIDWRIRLEPIFNVNLLDARELGVVSPDVRRGTRRTRDFQALEQWFIEAKLADLGPDYDFMSVRAGSQLFVSDFRGFVFKDINRGVRLFGTRFGNRDQFNVIFFDQQEKDINSELNSLDDDRHQNVLIANYFRQDFIFPGFTGLINFHYNNDQPSFTFDENGRLARPDPVGIFRPHEVNAFYIGVGGDGHIGRYNISTQFYHVFGEDSLNPLAGAPQTIDARMAAIEVSYDRDWIRFRSSYFYASGDDDPNDYVAQGFDTILDDPVFAGGEFSYWQRQFLPLFGGAVTQRKSLVPNLRSSKIKGQSNFVNPGLHLVNFGADVEISPKMRVVMNANYLWFDQTEVLETFTFQDNIADEIGLDLSIGTEYRPTLSDNIIFVAGYATLLPGAGFDDLFGSAPIKTDPADNESDPIDTDDLQALVSMIDSDTKHAAFVEMILTY